MRMVIIVIIIISLVVLPRRRRLVSAAGRAPTADILAIPPVLADDALPVRLPLPPLPGAAVLADDDGEDPERPHDDGDAGEGVGGGAGLVGEREAEPPVDDAEGDAQAADPDVHVGDPGAALEPAEAPVVQDAPQRLGEQRDEDHDAEDGVRVGAQAAGQPAARARKRRRGGGDHGH